MKKFFVFVFVIVIVGLFSSCGHKNEPSTSDSGDTVALKYAKLLQIVKYNTFTEVSILNPWKQGEVLHRYLLSPHFLTNDELGQSDATFIQTPLNHLVVYTAAHTWLLNQLGARQNIAGVCDRSYIIAKWARLLNDCGNAMNPDVEKIIQLNPDGLILSPFENSGGYGKVEQLGVPVIEAADYMETSALGRAEWMLFYGMLVGKEEEAIKLFRSVENNYNSIKVQGSKFKVQGSRFKVQGSTTKGKQIVPDSKSLHPLVMVDLKQSSAWYVPAGGSTLGRMIADAGGKYAFSDDKRSGSIPFSFETMLEKNHDADIWLIKYNGSEDITLNQLKQDFAGYTQFEAFRSGNVYGCNTDYVPFYEEVPFHPDWLLSDYVKIFNNDNTNLRYYKKVQSGVEYDE